MAVRRELTAIAAAAALLAACSSSKSSSGNTPATSAASSASPTSPASSGTTAASSGTQSAGGGSTVTVTESDFKIAMPTTSLKAGSYTFKVSNKGSFTHNLTFKGPGLQDKATDAIAPGGSGEVSVTLQKGTYDAYCSIDSHKEKGMELTLTVS